MVTHDSVPKYIQDWSCRGWGKCPGQGNKVCPHGLNCKRYTDLAKVDYQKDLYVGDLLFDFTKQECEHIVFKGASK